MNWQQLVDQYAAMTRRERVLVAGTLCVVITLLFWAFWLDPMTLQQQKLSKQLNKRQAQISAMQTQIQQQQAILARDPNAEVETQLADALDALADKQAALQGDMVDLILPEQMTATLTRLLAQTESVTLIEMSILPPESLVEEGGLYRHSLVIELEGRYFDLMKVLQRMEQLEQRFYWRHLDYQVTDYPKARLTLKLDTLGTEEEPIRVGHYRSDTVVAGSAR